MKVIVYGIAKNEAQFVDRFLDATQEADGVYILDTGSEDGTTTLLQNRNALSGVELFTPWRFDVARNYALSLVPDDAGTICFSFDLDEVPTPGWRDAVEKAFASGHADRIRYKYVWNHTPDGGDGISFFSEKCHTRRGWRWVKPVHEILKFQTPNERQVVTHEFTVHHWADDTKPRTSYLPLLELSVQEEPDDDRNAHYLGRELHNYGRHLDAIDELQRHLALPKAIWKPERAASMRYISKSYAAIGNQQEAEKWALCACGEAPGEREPWINLAMLYAKRDNHTATLYACTQALNITERPMTYICDPESWGPTPYDLAGIAAYYMGMKDKAKQYLLKAYELEPTDPRKLKNLEFVL
jgi:tetratricopeptide (TPR) repeat protein